MEQIMGILHFLDLQLISIAVVEGQNEVALYFSSFQQIMGKPLYIKS